jgi:hypothetical protein
MLDRGNFKPRTDLSNRYLGQDFKNLGISRGFTIRWIGVGTWELPYEGILKNHVQAWQMSRDNASRGNPQKLQELQTDSTQQELMRLLQEVLAVFRRSRGENGEPERVFSSLSSLYFEYLVRALEIYQRDYQQNADEMQKEQLDKYLPPVYLLQAIAAMAGRQSISHLNRNMLADYRGYLLGEFERKYAGPGEVATQKLLETLWELSDILTLTDELAERFAIYFEQLITLLNHSMIRNVEAAEDLLAAIRTIEPWVENQFAPNDFEQLTRIERAYNTWLRGRHPEGEPHWVRRTE